MNDINPYQGPNRVMIEREKLDREIIAQFSGGAIVRLTQNEKQRFGEGRQHPFGVLQWEIPREPFVIGDGVNFFEINNQDKRQMIWATITDIAVISENVISIVTNDNLVFTVELLTGPRQTERTTVVEKIRKMIAKIFQNI